MQNNSRTTGTKTSSEQEGQKDQRITCDFRLESQFFEPTQEWVQKEWEL